MACISEDLLRVIVGNSDPAATRADDGEPGDDSPNLGDGLLDDDGDDTSIVRSPRDFSSAERHRFRRWLADLVEPMGGLDAIDRGARARLMLRATRMKIWELDTGHEWFDLLLAATRALPGDDIPPPSRPQFQALAQVMLHELAAAARAISVSGPVQSRGAMAAYLQVERMMGDLLAPVEQSLLEVFADTVRVRGTIPLDPDLVAQHAAEARGSDPVVQSLRQLMLSHPDLVATRDSDTVISVRTGDYSALLAGGRCLDTIPGDWAVCATSLAGRRAFVARAGTIMLTAELRQRDRSDDAMDESIRFRCFRLSPLVSATGVAAREGMVLDGGVRAIETPRLDYPGVMGSRVLASLGVDLANVGTFIKRA